MLVAMKEYFIALVAIIFTSIYIGAFIFSERKLEYPSDFNATSILYILALVFLSWFIRYVRWWLLLSSLHGKTSFTKGFICYLSGFSYTASPGKVGELSRIIFYKKLQIKATYVISCFFTERVFDLIVVLILSSFVFLSFGNMIASAFFVMFIILFFLSIIYSDLFWLSTSNVLTKVNFPRIQRCFDFLKNIRETIIRINKPSLLLSSFILGLISWSLIAYCFIAVCGFFSVEVDNWLFFGIYPLAMLVGAISFIPGGIGSTEAAITLMLVNQGISAETALSIALLTRICTLWSAVWTGLASMFYCVFAFKNYP